MQFRNPFEAGVRFYSEAGSGVRPVYKSVLGKNGNIDLIEDGIDDLYAYIQSFKNSVDINLIVERYAHGDVYALEQRLGSYGDFVEVPTSYMDILNSIVDLRTAYEKTDMNISFEEYAKSIIDPAVNVVKDSVKEVINNVQESEQPVQSAS